MNKHILATALLSAGLLLSNAAQAQVQDLTTWTAAGLTSVTATGATLSTSTSGNASTEFNTSALGGTYGSSLSTTLQLLAGSTISFDWNFTTSDYTPYNDFAVFKLNDTVIKLADVVSVGNTDGSTSSTGWKTFSYNVAADSNSTLSFIVSNVQDNQVLSSLQLANVNVAAVPEPETYALMATGLLGLLFSRKKKVAVESVA